MENFDTRKHEVGYYESELDKILGKIEEDSKKEPLPVDVSHLMLLEFTARAAAATADLLTEIKELLRK